ncbi:MAG TPA: flagellar biosynthesis protein FlhF [Bacteroidota bacterium]|nr:flagellar biosynthesis protein FlhF [Bacteroidota bacterium]
MQIKKFVGTTIKEATEQMRAELGPDAIILNTRRVTSGKMLNFLGKDMLEITAALDDQPVRDTHPVERTASIGTAFQKARTAYGVETQTQSSTGHSKSFSDVVEEKRKTISPSLSQSSELALLHNEVEEMRQVLLQITDHIKYTKMPALPLQLQKIFLRLVNNDIDEKVAADIIQQVYARLTVNDYDNRNTIEQAIVGEISRFITTKSLPTGNHKNAYVVALVGPTGVGKTTTIAKLAAIHKLVHHQDVAIITADTYRIGAIEQLRTFAGIAEIPMQVVYQPQEMRTALKAFRKKDIVFIDTVGRSQRAKKEIQELRRFIEAAEPDEVHLMLNASLGEKMLLDVVERFKPLHTNRYIISKVDEAFMFGGFLNVLRDHKMPVSYLTNGQVVPDDIVTIDPSQLAAMISGANAHA